MGYGTDLTDEDFFSDLSPHERSCLCEAIKRHANTQYWPARVDLIGDGNLMDFAADVIESMK